MKQTHFYNVLTTWTGNRGTGTTDYKAYDRDFETHVRGKDSRIAGSSDPMFRGDATRYNPEELFVASLSSCHMLWYLHLAAANGVVVEAYEDRAEAVMQEEVNGAGRFSQVTLRPRVRIAAGGDVDLASRLHEEAGEKCFIANSVRVKLAYAPETSVSPVGED